jgi:hypothetical protein
MIDKSKIRIPQIFETRAGVRVWRRIGVEAFTISHEISSVQHRCRRAESKGGFPLEENATTELSAREHRLRVGEPLPSHGASTDLVGSDEADGRMRLRKFDQSHQALRKDRIISGNDLAVSGGG